MKNREFKFTLADQTQITGAILSEALKNLSPEERVALMRGKKLEGEKAKPETRIASSTNTNENKPSQEDIDLYDKLKAELAVEKAELLEMEKEYAELQEKIELRLKDKLSKEKTQEEPVVQTPINKNEISEDTDLKKTSVVENKEAIKTWFAKFPYPNDKTFEEGNFRSEQNGESVYEIKDHGDNTATISLSEDRRAQLYALNDFEYLMKGFDLVNQPYKKTDTIELIEEGVAEKQGENWIITKKPKIKFVSIEDNVVDKVKETKENPPIRLDREALQKEIEENIKGLLEKIKEKEPEIKNFELLKTKNGFLIKATIKIKTGKDGDLIRAPIDIKLELPLENKNDILSLGKESIDAGFMATKKVRKEFEPLLPEIIPGIKTYFENKYKNKIESMKIESEELVLNFE